MADQSYSIEFEGYWREPNKGGIPSKSGIYGVYGCVQNKESKKLTLNKLIYIGESGDVNDRVANHDRLPDWKKHLKNGEELCYAFGPAPEAYRERCEAAIIFKHKPPENTEYTGAFPFDKTTITIDGEVGLLENKFTVVRT
ncbi:GIY-YIG nuclease family protein [Ralstonia pseudosolanacearum]